MAEIQALEPRRFNQVAELLSQCGLPTDGLSAHVASTLVAINGDDIVGCAALELCGDVALLRSVAVAKPYRDQGIGHSLFESMFAMARRQHVTRLYLLTETAAGYFSRRGFVVVDRDRVPDAIKGSVEFTSACPASATAMRLIL